jgi:hypothetical protein
MIKIFPALAASLALGLFLAGCLGSSKEVTFAPAIPPVLFKHDHVTAQTLTDSIKNAKCPDSMALDASVAYPTATGSAAVDQYFADYAKKFVQSAAESDAAGDEGVCSLTSNLYQRADFNSYKPSPNILGVLYTIDSFTGGAHPDLNYASHNFDLAAGKEITIASLFPNPKDGIAKLYEYAYSDLCTASGARAAAQTVLGGTCGTDTKAPAALTNLKGPLDQLGHLVLTDAGALLSFSPYDIWSWSQGPYQLAIPKEKLIEMGAKNFWQ